MARAIAATWPRSAYCDAFGIHSPSALARRLIAALCDLDPSRAIELGQSTIGAADDEAVLLEAARSSWRSTTADRSVVVLDHVEEALRDDNVRAFIDSLFDRPHPSQDLIVCSRERPSMRATRFAAPHESLLIDADDLRFTYDEICKALPPGTSSADCALVERVTQGWPVGVLFMARAASEERLEDVAHRIDRYAPALIEDYVVQEVLTTADGLLLETFLACAAVPDCTSQDVAYAVGSDLPEAASRLAASPFIVRNEGKGVFELHPLLRATILQRYPVEVRALIARTAASHREGGNAVRAAKLYQTVEDLAKAADCLDTLDRLLSRLAFG